MKKEFEASARTVEEAIEKGLQELGVSIGDVDVQVIEEGSKGLFGLFGSRMAKVRLTLKENDEDPLGDLIAEETSEEKKVSEPVKAEPVPEKHVEEPTGMTSGKEVQQRPAPVRREARKPSEKNNARKSDTAKKADEAVQEKTEPVETEIAEQAAVAMEKPEIHMIPTEELDPESPAGTACAFLKEITRLMGVDVTIEMGTDEEGHVYGYMNGDTLGILIGRRGETLDALQYLTSLRVNRGREEYTRVTLDTENYTARRDDTLIRLANRMANRAVRTGRRVSLEPMNPYERRVIHFALQKNEMVDTHSEGDDPNRHVVITLKK